MVAEPLDTGCADREALEVTTAARAYEQALVDGDTGAATAWFDDGAAVSRFGPEGSQFGPGEVARLRAATAAVAAPEWLHEEARALAPGVVLHLTVLRRGDVTIQRTQAWVRRDAGWRVTHAHVSRPVTS